MASQGPLSPSSAAQGGAGSTWSGTNNVFSSNNIYASVAISSSSTDSRQLAPAGYGFSIPDGATIDGVLVEVEASWGGSGNSIRLDAVGLRSGGSLGSADTTRTTLTTTDTYISRGGETALWGAELTPALVNDTSFGAYVVLARDSEGSSATGFVDHMRITVYYTEPNTAPEITDGPAASYGSLTRLGPNNSPAVVSFTATDPEETGAGELDYEIRTATGGGGTLVASGTCTSGVAENVNVAYNASGLSGNGSQTLYLVVSDGTDDTEESFTLLQDNAAPTVGTISHDPSPVTGGS